MGDYRIAYEALLRQKEYEATRELAFWLWSEKEQRYIWIVLEDND